MKKFLLSILGLLTIGTSWAALPQSGYYRVSNHMSGRYVYVYDDKGSLDYGAMKADMGAIQLWKNLDRAITDPASVIYVNKVDSKFYDFLAQGTGVHQIIGVYVQLWDRGNDNIMIGATHSGITRYLCDSQTDTSEERGIINDTRNDDWRFWHFTPISSSSDNYFGLKPEIQKGSDYYTSFYASFPFSFNSTGMKAYIVDRVENGMAVIKEVEGAVAASTPVIIKCSAADPASNKLDIGTAAQAPSGNLLKGVYFNNPSKAHNNQTRNDKATMRVLGLMANGELGFVTSPDEFLAANRAYLTVPAGSPAEFKIVTSEEYEANFATVSVSASSSEGGKVYIGSEGTTSVRTTKGTKLSLVAVPADGYTFTNWTLGGSEVSTAATYEVTVSADCEYVANFEKIPAPRLYLTVSGKGDIKVSSENGEPSTLVTLFGHGDEIAVEEGETLYFYLLPSDKMMVKDFEVNGSTLAQLEAAGNVEAIQSVTNGKKVVFTMGKADVNATVNFDVDTAIESVGVDNVGGKVEYYDLRGLRVDPANLAPGFYFRRTGTHIEKVIIAE